MIKRVGGYFFAFLLVLMLCSCGKSALLPEDSVISEVTEEQSEETTDVAESAAEEVASEESAQESESVEEAATSEPVEEEKEEETESMLIAAEPIPTEEIEEPAEESVVEETEVPEETPAPEPEVESTPEPAPAPEENEGSGAVAKQAVFIRSYPSVDEGDIIGGVPAGASVTVLSVEYGWYYVNYNGVVGYAYGDFFN